MQQKMTDLEMLLLLQRKVSSSNLTAQIYSGVKGTISAQLKVQIQKSQHSIPIGYKEIYSNSTWRRLIVDIPYNNVLLKQHDKIQEKLSSVRVRRDHHKEMLNNFLKGQK